MHKTIGYTLIEVLITLVLIGMVILLVGGVTALIFLAFA